MKQKKMEFKQVLLKKIHEIELCFEGFLPREEGRQRLIMEALNYSIKVGGKRLRPIFLLETCRMLRGVCGDSYEKLIVMPFVSAIEMIHTYSLVHDDLPVMDNDKYRRGRLTTHAVYGEDMGVLAGDALLNYSFEIACRAFDGVLQLEQTEENYSDAKQLKYYQYTAKALQILSKKSGIYGMVGGQVVDVKETGNPLDSETLDFIYRLKTSALLEASMMVGAVLAGADVTIIDQIEEMAKHIGMAFQIQDDILDVTSTKEVLGKPIHSDAVNNKTTYVTLLGLEQAKKKVEFHSNKALELFDHMGKNQLFMRELIVHLMTREA